MVSGRSGIHEPVPEEAAGDTLLDRLNAFGERHALPIIIVAVALIIVTVLLFAKVLYDRSLPDRVERDLVSAHTIETLEALRKRYEGTSVEPRILATLGHRYAAEADLDKAKEIYTEFLSRHRGHVLADGVNRSLAMVEQNIQFRDKGKAVAQGEATLSTHPLQAAKVPNHPLQPGPIKERHPAATIRFKGKPEDVHLELFEDEAPNAVAAFISLAEQKYFEGMSFTRVGDGERLRLAPKKEGANASELAAEKTARAPEPGLLALVRKGPNNAAGEFEILLKSVGTTDEMTVFGRVYIEEHSAAAALLQKLEDKDVIESVKIDRKRDHEYKPEYLK